MYKNSRLLLLLVWLLPACSGKLFVSPHFKEKIQPGVQIAVLPFTVGYTGLNLYNLTEEEIDTIGVYEGLAFQVNFCKRLNEKFRLNPGEDPQIRFIPVDIMVLVEHNIDPIKISSYPPDYLCETLNADAVIYSRVEKSRFLPQLDSVGFSLSQNLKNKLKAKNNPLNDNMPDIPGNADPSYRITVSSRMMYKADSMLLWHCLHNTETGWDTPASVVIPTVNKTLVKNFPKVKPLKSNN